MKSVGRPVLSALRGQAYATQAAASQTRGEHGRFTTTPQEVKVTRLQNGVAVVSLENYSPLSRVAVLYNAGCRYEMPDNIGITHCIRAAANLSTQKSTAFLIAKQMQQIGGNLTCTTSRELVAYSMSCLRDDYIMGTTLLGQVAAAPVFKPWEVDSLSRHLRVDLELYQRSPEAQVIELLHGAAYRNTLGRSLYMHEDNVGSYSPMKIGSFIDEHHVPQGATVAGVGVDHEQLVILARKMPFSKSASAPPVANKAKYHGGEARLHMKGPIVHALMVTEGVPFNATSDFLAISLLQLSLGVGPYVKYGSNTITSKIGKAALSVASSPVVVNCINLSYSDSGLFGCQIAASAKEIRKVLGAVVGAMGQATKGSISEQDLQRAKKQLKVMMKMESESSKTMLQNIFVQFILSGNPDISLSSIDAAIDKITADDVNKIAKKVINGKPTYAVVGDLTDTPYLDELMTRV